MKKIIYLLVLFLLFITPAYTAQNHYLERALTDSGKAQKWGSMPISIYIQDNPYRNQVIQAFQTWQSSMNGLLRFTLSQNPNSAQIIVSFANNLPQNVAGLTSNSAGADSNIIKSHIRLLAPEYSPNRENYMYSVALHEIGHALGISGHSSNTEDVMYPQTTAFSKRQQLSSRDIETVKWLYTVKEDVLEKHSDYITNSKLAEAEAYVKKFPTATLGWSNLGLAYMQNEMYDKAEMAFKRGIQLNPNAFAIHKNLAVAYAVQKKYDLAYASAETAFKLNPNDISYLTFLSQVATTKPQQLQVRRYVSYYLSKHPEEENSPAIKKLRNITR